MKISSKGCTEITLEIGLSETRIKQFEHIDNLICDWRRRSTDAINDATELICRQFYQFRLKFSGC